MARTAATRSAKSATPVDGKSNGDTDKIKEKATAEEEQAEENGLDEGEEEDTEQYEVSKIVASRVQDGKKEFKVRWKGFSAKHDSWEPEEMLREGAGELLDEYLDGKASDGEGSSSTEDKYEVHRIVDKREKKDGTVEYRVRWKGYTASEDSWEPEASLKNAAADAIQDYEDAQEKRNKPKRTPAKAVATPQRSSSRAKVPVKRLASEAVTDKEDQAEPPKRRRRGVDMDEDADGPSTSKAHAKKENVKTESGTSKKATVSNGTGVSARKSSLELKGIFKDVTTGELKLVDKRGKALDFEDAVGEDAECVARFLFSKVSFDASGDFHVNGSA